MKYFTLSMSNRKRSGGFTLLQLVGVIVAISVVATVALQLVKKVVQDSRYAEARTEMRGIVWGIMGDPSISGNCGYVGDTGQLPGQLDDLVEEPSGVCGWNGPYVEDYDGTDSWKIDPFGRVYVYSEGQLYLKSVGGQEELIFSFADEYQSFIHNTISVTLPGVEDDNSRVFLETGGCDDKELSYHGDFQWRADSVPPINCRGDIYVTSTGGDTSYKPPEPPPVAPDPDDDDDVTTVDYGVLQYVGDCAPLSGPDSSRVSFQVKNTGAPTIHVKRAEITWQQNSNCWAGFNPFLESVKMGGTIVWDYQTDGNGVRAAPGARITFRDTLSFPSYATAGATVFDALVFKSSRTGSGYDVNMGGTNFNITFNATNTSSQMIYFNTCETCVPGDIQYVQNSIQTSPCDTSDCIDQSELIESADQCQHRMRHHVEHMNGGEQIKFEEAEPGLGEDGRRQTETFVVEVDDGSSTVRVKTKAATSSVWTTLNGEYDAEVNSMGFLVSLDDISGDTYTLSVTSVSNEHALSHVIFDFGNDSDVDSPEDDDDYYTYRNGDCNQGNSDDAGSMGGKDDDDDDGGKGGKDDDDDDGGKGGKHDDDDSADTPCDEEDGKITICHYPPGNPDNAHTITISTSAWPAHQAHGDECGSCESDDTAPDGSEDCKIHSLEYDLINPYPAEIPVYVNAVKVSWWNLPPQPSTNGHGGKGKDDDDDDDGGKGGKDDDNDDDDGNDGNGDASPFETDCEDTDGDGKITICHYPPGNPENSQTISISTNAWDAHQAHGDECGPCESEGASPPEAFLEELIIGNRTLHSDPINRLASGATISLESDELLIFDPREVKPNNFMNNFYNAPVGGVPFVMNGAWIDITFYGVDGEPYSVRFQVPECTYSLTTGSHGKGKGDDDDDDDDDDD